ncbi:MAG: hypothetical protein JWM05_2253 [Acidimicrobiales bacterium]|nr:hypothetical protein [Acidimicrobiales bacterium]
MRNRTLSLLVVCLLTVGGAAGCSKSKKSDSTNTDNTTQDTGSTGGGGGASGKVKAYCDSVDSFVKKAKAAGTDPTKLQALTTEAQDLAKKGTALTGISADEAKQVADCTAKTTKALTPG